MRLAGRVAIVTGGGSGIGKAIALAFAREGAQLALAARREKPLRAAAGEVEALGGRAIAVPTDVARRPQVDALVARTTSTFGRLDILVNAAAVFPPYHLLDLPEAEWQRAIEVNLTGAFHCVQAAARVMAEQRAGRIINVSSPAGTIGFGHTCHYGASKGGLDALTRCAAADLGPYGITVNSVCPGLTETETFVALYGDTRWLWKNLPIARPGRPADVTGLVVYLASDEGAFTTGAVLYADGGLTHTLLQPRRRP